MTTRLMNLQRRATRLFILEDSVDITFHRFTTVSDGMGGTLPGKVEVPEPFTETVRLIPQSDKVPVANQVEGYTTNPDFILLAEYTTLIKQGDTFTYQGIGFRVDHRHPVPLYEAKFDILKTTGGEPV